MVIARLTSMRDAYLDGHSQRVAELAVELARRAGGFSNKKLRLLYAAGLVHDLGKIGIPDSIIRNPGELNPAERKSIEDHPRVAHDFLSEFVKDHIVLESVMHHHENMDGSGYPSNQKDGQITMPARVLRIVDSFDAMMTRRHCRSQLTTTEAITDLRQHSNWYDPRLLKLFVGMILEK